MQNQQSIPKPSSSQAALPADFTFNRIGKPPTLLTRLGDSLLGESQEHTASSPSPPSTPVDKLSTTRFETPFSIVHIPLSERLGYPAQATPPPPSVRHFQVPLASPTSPKVEPVPQTTVPAPVHIPRSSLSFSQVFLASPPPSRPASTPNQPVEGNDVPMQPQTANNSTPMVPSTSTQVSAPMDIDIPSGPNSSLPSSISAPLPNVSADELYGRLVSLASERTAWDDILRHFQRCREEREELLRRHEETVHMAKREKDQADRVLAAAEAAFKLVESLRDKQEQRWEQEKVFAERAYAETLRLQQEQGPRHTPSTPIVPSAALPAVPRNEPTSSSTTVPTQTVTDVPSAVKAPEQPKLTAPAVASAPAAPTVTVAVTSVAPSASLQAIAPTIPIAGPAQSHPNFLDETPEQRQRREKLERLQAQKKAEIQARKRKDQQEESARIRAARANAEAGAMDVSPAQSKSATPQPAPSADHPASITPTNQQPTAGKQSRPVASVAVPTIQQAPTATTPQVAKGKSVAVGVTAQNVQQNRTAATVPSTTSPAQMDEGSWVKTSPVNPKTATVLPPASVTLTGLPVLPLQNARPLVSPQAQVFAPILAPIKRPELPVSKSVEIKQEPEPEPTLSISKSAPQLQQTRPLQQTSAAPARVNAPPTLTVNKASVPKPAPPSSHASKSPTTQFNVQDKDRSGRTTAATTTSDPRINPTPIIAVPKAAAPPQQKSSSPVQPVSARAPPPRANPNVNATNAAPQPQRHPVSFDSEADWNPNPRSPTPERSPSPFRPPTPHSRLPPRVDHYSPSPPRNRPIPRTENVNWRHYSPSASPPLRPRSRSRSPVVEVGRKRYRDNDDDYTSRVQAPRRTKVAEPLRSRSPDRGAQRYRQEVVDTRDLARTPPRPDNYPPQTSYPYETTVSYTREVNAPAPTGYTQPHPAYEQSTVRQGYESPNTYRPAQQREDYPMSVESRPAERARVAPNPNQGSRQTSGPNRPTETYRFQPADVSTDEPGLLHRMSEPKPKGRGNDASAASGSGARGKDRGTTGRRGRGGKNVPQGGGRSLSSRINTSLEDRLSK